MPILILGDCHGAWPKLIDAVTRGVELHGATAVIQVGDFGFEPELFPALTTALAASPFPVPVHAIDGNHEDHVWLWRQQAAGAFPRWASAYNLIVHGRGHTAIIDSLRVGFLGGALNSKSPQIGAEAAGTTNWVTDRDADHAAAAFNAAGVELVVTHSCPHSIGIHMRGPCEQAASVKRFITDAGFDGGPLDDCGEPGLLRLWSRLTRPPWGWVFGHFHIHREAWTAGTAFHCVGSIDGSDGLRRPRGYLIDTANGSWKEVEL